MKITLLLISILSLANLQAQTLDFNSSSASNGDTPGVLFSGSNGYEIPKGSGISNIFSAGIWCTATDANGQIKSAAMRYGQQGYDFFPGPISTSTDYLNSAYLTEYGNISNPNASKWYVTKTDIQNHIWNFNQTGYMVPSSIADWPGNGISNVGVAQNLAPFVDMNNNSIYEPSLGDYPDIRGDAAYYMIMNDMKGVHTHSGGDPLGIEVHTMMYQYASSDYMDSTTFVNFRVFNRGTVTYFNFKFGLFSDFNIGGSNDDLVGCDSLQNLMYVYNGDNNDEFVNGYGVNPPAFGIAGLNKSMVHFFPYSNNALSNPATPSQLYNLMSGIWANGSQWTYGGTGSGGAVTANFIYPGNPNDMSEWSEISLSNSGGDRRGVMIMEDVALLPGGEECYDFALLYSREQGNDALQNVNSLLALAATAKIDYDGMSTYNCNQVTLGVDELDKSQVGLYPNPSTGQFSLSFGDELISGRIIVTDMKGSIVLDEEIQDENVKIFKLDTKNGVYNVSIITNIDTIHKRLIITE